MAIPSFYHPALNAQSSTVNLDVAEASHAINARRLKNGQNVRLFDGNGLEAFGVLSDISRRSASVVIASFNRVEPVARGLSIAVAPPKGDRQKVMIDMLTQLGVSEIIPLRCEYSISKFSVNTLEKWRRVTIESAKQSQNPFLPKIHDSIALNDLLAINGKSVLVANADGQSMLEHADDMSSLLILVGPEGGFSDSEFSLFKDLGVTSIALGGHILRTEAAAIAAAAQFNLIK